MECGRSSPMPSLMCWSAPDSEEPAVPWQPRGQSLSWAIKHSLSSPWERGSSCCAQDPLHGISWSPRDTSGPLGIGQQLETIPIKALAPAPAWQRAEGRWARGKGDKLLGWDQDSLLEKEKPCMQAKQSREFIAHFPWAGRVPGRPSRAGLQHK